MKSLLNRTSFLILVSLFISASFSAAAQDKDWRPITPEDVSSKAPVVEPDADAEAIFWEVRIDDSSYYDLSMKHYVRVKVFTERGRERYSKFDIPFTKGLKIKDLAARVIRTDGSIVEIRKEDIFEREIVKANGLKLKAKSFAIPNIEPGVIVEYRYKEQFEGGQARGRRLEFQRDIPVRSLLYYYKPYQGEPTFKTFNFNDAKFIKDKNGYYLASRTNVPAFKQEPFMPPDDMVRPWMRLGSNRISFWSLVAKLELAQMFKKDSGDLKKTAAEITAGASTDDEKLQKLYEFCRTQISNTTFDPTITDELREKLPEIKSPKDVLKRKSASSGFIDMLFGALATASGFDARVAFIGDRSKMFTSVRTIDQEFLHPGAIAIKIGDRWRFYNPGTKFLPIGKLVWYEEDSAAELVGEKGIEWVQTPASGHEFSVTKRIGKFKLTEDGTLEGDVSIEIHGQPAIAYRLENYDESQAKLEELIKDDVKRNIAAAEVSDIAITNLDSTSQPVGVRYKVKVPNYAQKTGRRMFLQPGFFEYGRTAVFSSSDRRYDVFFRYPWSEIDQIEITFPKNFDLDNAETPAEVADPERIGSNTIKIRLDKANGVLLYDRKFYFGGGGHVLFKSGLYQPLKNLFDAFHKADSHTISLRQK